MKIILVNGPIGSGKTEVSASVAGRLGIESHSFSDPLHEIAISMSGENRQDYFERYHNRDLKEVECNELFGYTPRTFVQFIAESLIKPNFGRGHFGALIAKKLLSYREHSLVSDLGFEEELAAIAAEHPEAKIYIMQLERDGCQYDSFDTRGYVFGASLDDPDISIHHIDSNKTIEEVAIDIIDLVEDEDNNAPI